MPTRVRTGAVRTAGIDCDKDAEPAC